MLACTLEALETDSRLGSGVELGAVGRLDSASKAPSWMAVRPSTIMASGGARGPSTADISGWGMVRDVGDGGLCWCEHDSNCGTRGAAGKRVWHCMTQLWRIKRFRTKNLSRLGTVCFHSANPLSLSIKQWRCQAALNLELMR